MTLKQSKSKKIQPKKFGFFLFLTKFKFKKEFFDLKNLLVRIRSTNYSKLANDIKQRISSINISSIIADLKNITPRFVIASIRRNLPLFLAVIFVTPSVIFFGFFIYNKFYKTPIFADTFTGKVKVSRKSTTISTSGEWYTSLAHSGDGINGDAEAGTFNPIHPGGGNGTEPGAGLIAYGSVILAAQTTIAQSQFIGFKPSTNANLAGVQIILENFTSTSLSNVDVEVELLRFPSVTCTTSCSGYVSGTQGAYTYPSDTVVERKTIYQFNKGLSGENLAPGQFGRATFDYRFDTPLAVGATAHYGIRITNLGNAAPSGNAFGVWAQAPQLNGFPKVNGTIRSIGVDDIESGSAPTVLMPITLTANSVLGGSATLLSGMVIGNSLAGAGMPTVRRTENEHWTATYSPSDSNWTLNGSVNGTQNRKLVLSSNGSSGQSWVDDSTSMTTLTADSAASTRLCVSSIVGFATSQYVDIWDSDTATIQRIISALNATDSNCSNGPSIILTAAATAGFSSSKNATVARSIWKQRIIQGAIQPLQKDTDATAVICVSDNSKYAVGGTIAIWDSDSVIITKTISSFAGSCSLGQPITLNSSPGAAVYTTGKTAYAAEVSATISNTGTPTNGDYFKWTTFNHGQNPTDSTFLARTTSVSLAYAKSTAPATSNVNYPFLSNRHVFFVAYGDGETTPPTDGDIIIVGNGKADPDSGDSPSLLNDINWASYQGHVVNIDRSWNAPMAYSGTYGTAVGNGAGTLQNFAAWSQNGGWVSALVCPGSQLGIDNSAKKKYRINIPGKIVVDSDASVAFGSQSSPIPSSSGHDIFFDTVSPEASTLLTVDSPTTAILTVASTANFAVGDTIVLDDNNSVPTTRVIAAIESPTSITLTAVSVNGYTVAQGAFIAKGMATELPTGSDRRAGIYTMAGLNAAATPVQSNIRNGRVSLYASGSAQFRKSKSDLAVDIQGEIDSGALGNNLTNSGDTWLDVRDDVVGNWQPLDKIAVGGGTNQLADNYLASDGMAGTDDINQMPLWTGLAGYGGRNALPAPNAEIAEIGTIPLTNIYNADYNSGTPVFSANYNNSSIWTIFGDAANTEVNDAVYFGDQGNSMLYALEYNIGALMNASVDYVWEYYKSGTGWTSFTPRDAYLYTDRVGVSLPLSVGTTSNLLTVTLAEGGTAFGLDQIVKIVDNDSPAIYRRLGTVAPTATTLTFTEPVPAGYTTDQSATVSRLNGGEWVPTDPSSIFSTDAKRKIIAWTPDDLGGTPAKTTINGVSAYWVRARINNFTSWTTSPTNKNTPVSMGGVENLPSSAFNVSSGVQEAKVTNVTAGSSFDPNESYTLQYGNSSNWVQMMPIGASAPFTTHIKNGVMSQNINTADFHISNENLTLGDYTVTAKVRMRTVPDATPRKIGIVLRDTLDGNGYGALIEKTNSVARIGLYPMSLGAEGATWANANKAFTADTWYWIKANVAGTGSSTVLNAKFWADGSGEPGSWDVTYTTNAAQGLWPTGRMGLFADAMISDFDDISVVNGVTYVDSFDEVNTWALNGSIHGAIGTVTPGTPFISDYINLTLKQKGGWNGTSLPETGDEIYISSTSTRSYKGISSTGVSAITTSNANTKYENIDFEWNPVSNKYDVHGSASGDLGTATPGSAYAAAGGVVGLTISSGSPTSTKFGDRMLLLQDNLRRNNGSWIGNNGIGSAVLFYPTYALTSSAIATRYNIEGLSSDGTARQNGTIDFWFKTNYSDKPSIITHPKGMYLFDYANQGNSDRLFIRHSPDGNLEAAIFAGAAQGTILKQSFSATAGQWYHFRLAWDETVNVKRAWLDGVPFSTGQSSVVGARGANAGIVRVGNAWTYDAPFDGSIDELAIFDDDIDTSTSCNWGDFSDNLKSSAWTGGETVNSCPSGTGVNIFRASFDRAMNPQEGFVWADYAFGNPAMIFTSGADTGNDRIRVITYPQRTRIWIDNTGEKYTPSARIKYGSGYLENATLATLAGWNNNYTFHHKAANKSTTNPTYSPVLNLKRSTHIWSVEPITQNGATLAVAPINAGLGFAAGSIGLSGLNSIKFSDVSMDNQYSNFSILTNAFTSLVVKPAQQIANSVFYNFYDRAYTVTGKTQGSNYVGADFITTHFAAGNVGAGYNTSLSQNVGIDGSIFMGNRNAYVTVPPAAANGAASFFSGRLFKVDNSEFHNNGVTGTGTSGALNFSPGVAKVDMNNNIFSINTNGVRLYGNSFFNMANNIFEGSVGDGVVTAGGEYGAGIRVAFTTSSVAISDKDSSFGRGLWNETDIGLPPNTGTFEAESLIQFTGDRTQFNSPLLFGTTDYPNMVRLADHYLNTTIPGTDIRGNYSSNPKDICNSSTFGNMRTTGADLTNKSVRTAGGYGWMMEPTNSDIDLDYAVKIVGVANKPLAITGYIKLNDNYGPGSLPTVSLSGLGMGGANLTWTAATTPNTWQQFVVSGTPTESALAELKISTKANYVVSDSGTSEIISGSMGNYLPVLVEDNDKSWIPNQWVGYKFKDVNNKVFDIVRNTDKLLYLKGIVVPHLLNTTFAALSPGDYQIYKAPQIYIDDVSVLSGSVDTGTLDYHSGGQPVSPWLSTGLTAEGVWSAQVSSFANSAGSFGQLLGDSLIAQYGAVSDPSTSTTEFDTNLSSSNDNFYLNGAIIFTEGNNKGAVRRISGYNGANKTITVDPGLPYAPSNGNKFAILAATASSGGSSSSGGGATAEEIWSYSIRRLTDSTLSGGGTLATEGYLNTMKTDIIAEINENQALIQGLSSISAADVWSYSDRSITNPDSIWEHALSDIGTTGSVGKLIKDNLNATVSSRSTVTAADVWASASRTLTDYSTSAIALAVWQNATRTLTSYGNDITAADVWNVLSSSLTTIDTIGNQLATNVDATISSRASQASINLLNNISASDVWEYSNRSITDPDAIWEYALADISTTGSVGKLIKDNLNATISSRSTVTAADIWLAAERTLTSSANFNDPTTAQIATAVWGEANRTLTNYGNNITAADVWSVLSSSLTTVGSIGKQLSENVDVATSTRASQDSIDALNDITAADVWNYATRTITGDVTLTADSRKAIWDSACAILNNSGSVGKLVCDNLDTTVSSRSTLTASQVWAETTRTITNLENPALAALANSVWTNATKELTYYGNDITAKDVWDVLTSSLTTIDSIGKMLTVNIDDTISSRASQSSLNSLSSNIATLMNEIGTGNITAIRTDTDLINWNDVTGLITTSGDIKAKTETINWGDVTGIKTSTDIIDWEDINGIKLKTDSIDWGDISNIKSNVAILITEIGVGNISAIKTKTNNIDWSNITGIVTTSGLIKDKTDNINWSDISTIKTSTGSISWADVTGIKLKTDTIDWGNIATLNSKVDVTVSSRASQSSLDSHEASESTFRTNTTNTLGAINVNVASILNQLSTIDTKIDSLNSIINGIDTKINTIDTSIDAIKLVVDDTVAKVTAMQTVTNNILSKWGTSSAQEIIGYVNSLETSLGDPTDATSSATIFGKLNHIKENGGGSAASSDPSDTINQIYTQTQTTHEKLLELEVELGYKNKTATAYEDMLAVKEYIDTVESSLSTLDTRTSSLASSVTNVSNDLKNVTDKVGKVNVDSFTQLLEVKKTDIDYLKNKTIELQAVSDINRQLLEKTVNEPVVKVILEWGSVIMKFVIVNPSDSTTQKIPFKAFLPKEVKQEYIMDLGGLNINFDTSTEQYYVTADITLKPGESITRSVEIKDIWIVSPEETASLRKQADEMSGGLKSTAFFAQGLTLKTDINTRLDKITRKQKDNSATPQDHILAYRENQEDMKAIQENLKGLKDLVLNSGIGNNFLASIGGIQTFATWGIMIALIFGMGALGCFYYILWKKKIVTEVIKKGNKSKSVEIELPTPAPYNIPAFNYAWAYGLLVFFCNIPRNVFNLVVNGFSSFEFLLSTLTHISKQTLTTITLTIIVTVSIIGLIVHKPFISKSSKIKENLTLPTKAPTKDEKIKEEVAKMTSDAVENKKIQEQISGLLQKANDSKNGKASTLEADIKPIGKAIQNPIEKYKIVIQDFVDSVNVRENPDINSKLLTKITKDREYEFVSDKDHWYQILLGNGIKGWVFDENVKKISINSLALKEPAKQTVLGAATDIKQLLVIKQTPTDWLNVRENPSINAPIVTKVYPGESYPFLELQSGWYKILLKDMNVGWVSSEFIRVEKDNLSSNNQYIEVFPEVDGGLNIRQLPNTDAKILKTIYVKNKYLKTKEQGDWIEIELLDGTNGWVFKQFTKSI
jgi:hypothetical protein